MMSHQPHLLTALLRDVSRSFYLTLRVLPAEVRTQISIAYLLARTSDTIADTDLLPAEKRLIALEQFRARLDRESGTIDLGELAGKQSLQAERVLLSRIEETLSIFTALATADELLIREVLRTIIAGQSADVRRFGIAGDKIAALQSEEELHTYTHQVAGCVGEFWTKMCRAHVFPEAPIDDSQQLADGRRFGQGLQLINILRDLPRDLRAGRCYLPQDRLGAIGLKPEDLLTPENVTRLRPLFDEYLRLAESHLQAGWDYTNRIPYGHCRLKLACAWPALIGLKTIRLLEANNPIDPRIRLKVSRCYVWGIIGASLLSYPAPPLWKKLFAAR